MKTEKQFGLDVKVIEEKIDINQPEILELDQEQLAKVKKAFEQKPSSYLIEEFEELQGDGFMIQDMILALEVLIDSYIDISNNEADQHLHKSLEFLRLARKEIDQADEKN